MFLAIKHSASPMKLDGLYISLLLGSWPMHRHMNQMLSKAILFSLFHFVKLLTIALFVHGI